MLSKGKLRIFLNKYFTSLNSHKLNGKNILIFLFKILENLIILYLMAGRHHFSYLFP